MVPSVKRGLDLLQKKGLIVFVRKLNDYFMSQLRNLPGRIYLSGRWLVYNQQDSISLSVKDIEAKFTIEEKYSFDWTLQRFKGEKETIEEMIQTLENDDIFYDIGANTGLYSCFAGQICTDGEIIAFEPYPPNIRELKLNFDLNRVNGTIVRKALSNKNETVKLSVPKNETPGYGGSSIVKGETHSIEIDAICGDKLINHGHIPQPNVVKIDVEGAERFVVEGLENAISHYKCRAVYCEIHFGDKDEGTADNGDQLWSWFEERGFTVERGHEANSSYHLIARSDKS